jgi:hypothetical protein
MHSAGLRPKGHEDAMPFDVQVPQGDLVRALKRIARALRGSKRDGCTLGPAGGRLSIASAGVAVSVPYAGDCTESVTVPLAFVKFVGQWPESEERVHLHKDGASLRAESPSLAASFACTAVTDPTTSVALQLGAPILHVLAAAERHTPDSLRAAGLETEVSSARSKRDEAIERALRHLLPFEVTRDEIANLIQQHVQKIKPR